MTNLFVIIEENTKKYIVRYTVEAGPAKGKLIQSVFSNLADAEEFMEITRKGGSLLFSR